MTTTTPHSSSTERKLLLALFACGALFHTQAQDLLWAGSMGGTGLDRGLSIAVDAAGNTYTTGFFQGTVDFDPGPGTFEMVSAGGYDVFITKLDAAGDLVWAKKMGGTANSDQGYAIALDADENIYVAGVFGGTADFDPGPGVFNMTSTGAGTTDVFVSKLGPDGGFLWARQFAGQGFLRAPDLAIDPWGNVLVNGHFQGTADFDPGPGTFNLTSGGVNDAFVVKLDPTGGLLWAKQFTGESSVIAESITTDSQGNVYSGGHFLNDTDFDPGPDNYTLTATVKSRDMFICKLDASGNFVWARHFASPSDMYTGSIACDDSGALLVSGRFTISAVLDPGIGSFVLTSAGMNDAFVCKMSDAGDILWGRSIGGPGQERAHGLALDAAGNVYCTGFFSNTADFDPGPGTFNLTSAGGTDAFVCKLDGSGNFVWAVPFSGPEDAEGNAIAVGPSGTIHSTGSFKGTIDFDPGPGQLMLVSQGQDDVYIHKLAQCGVSAGTDVQVACNSFTWIDGLTYTSSTDQPTFTLTDQAGCDSTVTLQLTITTVDDAVTLVGATLTAAQTDAAYQWLDCDNSFAPITGETDQSYSPAQNGNYAVAVTLNGCTVQSACVEVLNTSVQGLEQGALRVYPNPAAHQLTLDGAGPLGEVFVLDMQGRLVHSVRTAQERIILDVEAWAPGAYVLRVGSVALRVVKE
ncbi:MAG: SBBP repeat-containing protein [Flavobacteriales bacterium]|nr:SBBP repeat-containing protein [Flavobacteriales bacterium]